MIASRRREKFGGAVTLMGRCGADGRFAWSCGVRSTPKLSKLFQRSRSCTTYSTSTSICICTRITRAVACLPHLELDGARSGNRLFFQTTVLLFVLVLNSKKM